jgi:DNA-binding NtrC family response regulator
VQINCAAVPPSLFESELFGHEKGAFTDAKTDRQGLLEAAHEGTLFLDEIGEMPVELQSKLVLALEKKQFRRVGGTRERRMDARLIAATNRDLGEAVREGRFRQDLYYRLKVFTLELPPLRERREELFVLADHFIALFARKYRKAPPRLSTAARESMRRYAWPGNVRELEHVLERAVLLSKTGLIEPRDLNLDGAEAVPAATEQAASSGFDLHDPNCTLGTIEQSMILEALRLTGGNVSEAARLLGVGRGFLRRRIERYDLETM